MSVFSATLSQIANGPPPPRKKVDMEPFCGLTHVTTREVAKIMKITQDNARYYVRTMCEVGALVEDGEVTVITSRAVRKTKRFKIVQGGNHGAEI
jgi:hypothetical protein